MFDEHLHFNTHIKQIIHKANNVLSTIKQTINIRDVAVIQLLYTTLVQPNSRLLFYHMESTPDGNYP